MSVLRALIIFAISVVSVDVSAARAAQAESASLSGTATDAADHALSNTGVQLRNVSTGEIVGHTTTNALGQFSFLNIPAGNYLAEVVSGSGQILATSAAVVVSSGWDITGVNVTTPAAARTGGHFLTHRSTIILGAAAAAGVAGGIAMASGSASPSQ